MHDRGHEVNGRIPCDRLRRLAADRYFQKDQSCHGSGHRRLRGIGGQRNQRRSADRDFYSVSGIYQPVPLQRFFQVGAAGSGVHPHVRAAGLLARVYHGALPDCRLLHEYYFAAVPLPAHRAGADDPV